MDHLLLKADTVHVSTAESWLNWDNCEAASTKLWCLARTVFHHGLPASKWIFQTGACGGAERREALRVPGAFVNQAANGGESGAGDD